MNLCCCRSQYLGFLSPPATYSALSLLRLSEVPQGAHSMHSPVGHLCGPWRLHCLPVPTVDAPRWECSEAWAVQPRARGSVGVHSCGAAGAPRGSSQWARGLCTTDLGLRTGHRTDCRVLRLWLFPALSRGVVSLEGFWEQLLCFSCSHISLILKGPLQLCLGLQLQCAPAPRELQGYVSVQFCCPLGELH